MTHGSGLRRPGHAEALGFVRALVELSQPDEDFQFFSVSRFPDTRETRCDADPPRWVRACTPRGKTVFLGRPFPAPYSQSSGLQRRLPPSASSGCVPASCLNPCLFPCRRRRRNRNLAVHRRPRGTRAGHSGGPHCLVVSRLRGFHERVLSAIEIVRRLSYRRRGVFNRLPLPITISGTVLLMESEPFRASCCAVHQREDVRLPLPR